MGLLSGRVGLILRADGALGPVYALQVVQPDIKRYENIIRQLKAKIGKRRVLLDEKKNTPAIQVFRHRELVQKIATLTEDIEELKSEKALIINQLDCSDDHGMTEVKQRVASMESSLETLDQQEKKYTAELDAALVQYTELQQQAADMDAMELDTARHGIRPDKEYETVQRLQVAYGKRFDPKMLTQSRKDIADLLDETSKPVSVHQKLRKLYKQQDGQHQRKTENFTRSQKI